MSQAEADHTTSPAAQPPVPSFRGAAEKLVEALIAFLDETDPEPDREEDDPAGDDNPDDEDNGDAEPSLGSQTCSPMGAYVGDILASRIEGHTRGETSRDMTGDQSTWAAGTTDDREDEHDGSEPDEDDEPSLGSFDRMINQTNSYQQRSGWAGHCLDAELDRSDYEPSLGSYGSSWTADKARQELWASGGADDREQDCDGEPSLGWTVDGTFGGDRDLEID